MTLIAVLVALFFERFVGTLDDLREFGWLHRYAEWWRGRWGRTGTLEGVVGLLLVLAGPILLVALVLMVFEGVMLGLFELLAGIVILLFCLGPRDLDEAVESWAEAVAAGDDERVERESATLLQCEMPAEPGERAKAMGRAIFFEANRRLFAVIFWFIVLGPVGAILYRLSSLLEAPREGEATDFHRAAHRLAAILDWLPARLTALGYALCGSFDHAFAVLRRELVTKEVSTAQNRELLAESGAEAMRLDERPAGCGEAGEGAEPDYTAIPAAAMRLVLRVLIVYITALSLMTIGGWVG